MGSRVWASIAVWTPFVLAGCFGSSSVKQTGSYVGGETFGQIRVGETSDQWVLGALGQPTSSTQLQDGSEMWRWEWQRTAKASGAAVPVLSGGSSQEETTGAAWVQVRDGLVVSKGRDAMDPGEVFDEDDD